MFDFHHAFNIDVIVDEWLRVLSKSVFPAHQLVPYIILTILASPITLWSNLVFLLTLITTI
uniref:Uncharacterized protein n=1 Tax=Lepeophtheirus salmonis TaxID=72036 RepID=A0A0K2V4N7_LEPSM